ncbi:Uncharacterised protein [[Clostridium] sordellii]|uniref:DUF7167 family protein n=1 Tax=Paraclostridium sordellii TaxID=1505 RepID=UPI0005DF3F83|nr:hypothetical protein [Paeniclostridium sordellii]CEQ01665.1 Uncharacterised protein [[Clostridium] sordellii] [Paeniclostridium sordellii]
MNIEFTINCMGYSVGEFKKFKMKIDDNEFEDMSEDDRRRYMEEVIFDYILENLKYKYKIKK